MGGKRAHLESGEARRIRLITLAVIAPLIVVTAVAMVLLWPGEDAVPDDAVRADQYAGVVLTVNEEPCPGPPEGMEGLENTEFAQDPAVQRCGTVRVELDEGPDAGTKVTVQMPTVVTRSVVSGSRMARTMRRWFVELPADAICADVA